MKNCYLRNPHLSSLRKCILIPAKLFLFQLLSNLQYFYNPSHPDPRGREKINLNVIFTLLCGALKGFMKVLKTFIQPFAVKLNCYLNTTS